MKKIILSFAMLLSVVVVMADIKAIASGAFDPVQTLRKSLLM